MNREDVIRMAREAGFDFNLLGATFTSGYLDQHLERFAALVAAAEREACAKVAEDTGNISGNMNKTWRNGCFDAAFAIRARGDALAKLNKAAEDNGEPL
jgi:hypothetical protein